MTLQDLKDRIAAILHRSDLTTQMDDFIGDAQQKIERRFGITLASIDPIPTGTETLFLLSSLQSAYEYLNNGDNAVYYHERFELEADRQNVLNPGTVTDPYVIVDGTGATVISPPYIHQEIIP
jgi:hypothetical protein